MSLLENIKSQQDLAALDENQRVQLCLEIRDFLINKVSKTGGHLASNLGVVELTVAIETVFDTAKDRLVFDVGHQSYIHKLLTGRQADFDCLRQFGGMAGFPKPNESVHDAFVAGHASSSVSIALGMARARTLSKQDYQVIALIGDGAATGGMAYEGLADAAVSNEPIIVILNDNAMSIDHNVGGMASHLSKLRTKERYLGMKQKYRNFTSKIPGGNFVFRITRAIKDRLRRMLIPTTIFENMGFTYFGPVDGHDTEDLIALLRLAKNINRPVLLHVMTQKGRGYLPAEKSPKKFHGIGKFDPATGEALSAKTKTFSDAFGETMLELVKQDEKVCAITAAMPGGTGLLEVKKQFPKRLFDVGIAEEHAVSMAGGLAKQGMKPVVAIYSTFLQRSYDMIMQDVGMQKLNVIFAVDRAGLVGEDGETHHGIYDIGFLRQVPDMTVLCPGSCAELQDMLNWAIAEQTGPVALRYPRGGDRGYSESAWGKEKVVCHKPGSDVTLITYGTMLDNVTKAAALLQEQGISASVLRLLTVAPIPVEELAAKLDSDAPVVVVEETAAGCGIKEAISWAMKNKKIYGIDLGHRYITHGAMNDLYRHYGLDADSIAKFVQEVVHLEN